MNKIKSYIKVALIAVAGVFFLTGCGPQPTPPPMPHEVEIPQAIMDNSGEFMCPYTQDGVLAEWTDKAINVDTSANIGGAVAGYAASKALERIPFIGGILGQKAGNYAARKIALEAIGGEEFLKESSDISFNTLNDLAVYIYAMHSSHEHYAEALEATQGVYPDLKMTYFQYIQNAPLAITPRAIGSNPQVPTEALAQVEAAADTASQVESTSSSSAENTSTQAGVVKDNGDSIFYIEPN